RITSPGSTTSTSTSLAISPRPSPSSSPARLPDFVRRPVTALVCAGALSVAAFAGCGGDSDSGAADTALARFAPADTPLYVQGAVRPGGELKDSVQTILDRFPN